MTKSTFIVSVIARIVSAGLLFWALARHPYDYYILLRWVVSGSSAFSAYIAAELNQKGWIWIMGIVAVFFNPIIPVHLSRPIWTPIDIITGIIIIISLFSIKERKRQNGNAK